jgi:hypothetical protein
MGNFIFKGSPAFHATYTKALHQAFMGLEQYEHFIQSKLFT